MRSSLLFLVIALCVLLVGIWGYAETSPVHHEEVVLEVELESSSGAVIHATITRVKSVETIPFWVEYEVSGLEDDAATVWMMEQPVPQGNPATQEIEGSTARFVSPSNARDHTIQLRVSTEGDEYQWEEMLDFPLHNLTEILLDASQLGATPQDSVAWSATNGDPTDEATFPIAHDERAQASLISEWPNVLQISCRIESEDGTETEHEIQALVYFQDGPPFEFRGTAGSFFDEYSEDQMEEILANLSRTMEYVGLNMFITAANNFFGWPDSNGDFSIGPIHTRSPRGYTATDSQFAALFKQAEDDGFGVGVQILACPYWNDSRLGLEYQGTGGGPHAGFMLSEGFLEGEDGLRNLYTSYIPLFMQHPSASLVLLGAEMSDVDTVGGPEGQAFWKSIIEQYRASGYSGALSYARCMAEKDLRWVAGQLLDTEQTGIPFGELTYFGATFYTPLAESLDEDPSIGTMYTRALEFIYDFLFPLYQEYGQPLYIADMYCFALDGCSYATVWGDFSWPPDEAEQLRWTTAWLRAFAAANAWTSSPWIAGITVGEFRMAPPSTIPATVPEWAKQKAYINLEYERPQYTQLLRCYLRDCP